MRRWHFKLIGLAISLVLVAWRTGYIQLPFGPEPGDGWTIATAGAASDGDAAGAGFGPFGAVPQQGQVDLSAMLDRVASMLDQSAAAPQRQPAAAAEMVRVAECVGDLDGATTCPAADQPAARAGGTPALPVVVGGGNASNQAAGVTVFRPRR
ncbi:MAG: hypothetical protein R3F55_18985 [Alphaproteobacteria bacterium]